MEKIEELKEQAKELEFNKRQMEKRLYEIELKIAELKDQRYYLNAYGGISFVPKFFDEKSVKRMKQQGNFFETTEEAEKESKKRDLKNEIREFAKGRNGDWQLDWENNMQCKYYLIIVNKQKMSISANYYLDFIPEFCYFKNSSDAQKAIELFGDRILELYVD
jgi:hypothetical protein|nr:MAG TPA: hypothetical protein [Caudoviricetes sp.]